MEDIQMPRKINEIGNRYGQLIVIKEAKSKVKNVVFWTCQCECGNKTNVRAAELRRGHTTSCGCQKYSGIAKVGDRNHKWTGYKGIHGSHWKRCRAHAEKKDREFSITIQEAWNLFKKQKEKCALSGQKLIFGKRFNKDETTASLDRIDSSKGYTVKNCQWVHKYVNYAKKDKSVEEFVAMCKMVAKST